MTKELEALERIESTTISSRVGDWGMEYWHVKDLASTKPYFDTLHTALTELEQLREEVKTRKVNEDILVKDVLELTTELRELRATPTADEVCEALSDYCKKTVYYTNLDFDIERGFVIQWYKEVKSVRDIKLVSGTKDRLHFYKELPPHLINLISRFYMGQTE